MMIEFNQEVLEVIAEKFRQIELALRELEEEVKALKAK